MRHYTYCENRGAIYCSGVQGARDRFSFLPTLDLISNCEADGDIAHWQPLIHGNGLFPHAPSLQGCSAVSRESPAGPLGDRSDH